MTQPIGHLTTRTVLITGANAGIGKDVARQLALRNDITRIFLGCRHPMKAAVAQQELEGVTGRSIFSIVALDVRDLDSVRAAVAGLDGPLDALVMNAGGTGGKTPGALTPDGVTEVFAVNILGHVALLEGLLAARKLTDIALLVGSEAVRGVRQFRIPKPSFTSSSVEEFASTIDGSYFAGRRFQGPLAYGQAKYLGALWMGYLARHHPDLRFITMSPGSTIGTNGLNDLPAIPRYLAQHLLPLLGPPLGLGHPLQVGAARIVEGLTLPSLRSGTFYASAPGKLTGPVTDQADIVPDLHDPTIQDHAADAIHRYLSLDAPS